MSEKIDYFSLYEHCLAGIMHTDENLRITMANKASYELLGHFSVDQLKDEIFSSYHLDSSHQELFDFYLEKTVQKGKVLTLDFPLKKASGERIWLSISGIALDKVNGIKADKGIVWTLVDISSRKEMEDQLTEQSNTDYLTGISNRRHFISCSEQLLSEHRSKDRPLCVLMLDIDHFKKINDNFGHSVGDRAIRQLADICRTMISREDLLGRLGGEEFAILLSETSLPRAIATAERIRREVESSQEEPAMTVSIGVAELGEKDDIDALISRADEALFVAKRGGRNRVICAEI